MEVIQFHICCQVQPSQGHFVVILLFQVLYATIIFYFYECPLQDQFSAEESKKDLCSNKLPKSKLDKVSQVFGQLKKQNSFIRRYSK